MPIHQFPSEFGDLHVKFIVQMPKKLNDAQKKSKRTLRGCVKLKAFQPLGCGHSKTLCSRYQIPASKRIRVVFDLYNNLIYYIY